MSGGGGGSLVDLRFLKPPLIFFSLLFFSLYSIEIKGIPRDREGERGWEGSGGQNFGGVKFCGKGYGKVNIENRVSEGLGRV